MAAGHRTRVKDPAKAFISTWKTDNLSTGSSTNTQVKLPLVSTGTYKFSVNWGDGSSSVITSWNQAEVTHTYAAIGTYTITITGFIKGWSFGPETPSPPTTGDRLKLLTITQFGCLRFTNDAFMFHGCQNLTLTTVTDMPNLKGIINAHGFLRRCYSLTTVSNVNKWDVSKIENFRRFFGLIDTFNDNIGNWNVGKGANFNSMFYALTLTTGGNFNNGGDSSIGNWDMSSAIDIAAMFLGHKKFNQNVGAWNTSNVTNMTGLFFGNNIFPYGEFNNGGSDSIKNWDTSKVTNMSQMFQFQGMFNQPIGSWNTSNVTIINGMFTAATVFNQNIGNWDTSKVTDMNYLFYAFAPGQSAFNQNISNWDTSKVTTMREVFLYSDNFNQPIGNWNVSLVTNFTNFMFGKTNLNYSAANYDALLIGWASRPVKPNLSINFGTIKRTAASDAAKTILTSAPNNWTIVDGGLQA